jgi:hypothetical protein
MNLLLREFDDVFTMSTNLLPARCHNRRIHLLLDTTLVAVRPYRYPHLVKDEMEQ